MRVSTLLCAAFVAVTTATTPSVAGLEALIQRRLPEHVGNFEFEIVNAKTLPNQTDEYTVTSLKNGRIIVAGNSLSALSVGLRRYLTDVVHVDIYWFIGSRLFLAPSPLPTIATPLTGASVVPYRYHFNTVTFSYTAAFWTWEDWELELDWLALRGVNLPLAWVGIEKTIVEVFQEIGLSDADISSYLSGPAFQAWNRFGNIQGSWGGDLPMSWINQQFVLQKKIIKRMIALGMTPILPAFTGFVPRSFSTDSIYPTANVTTGSQWEAFPVNYTETMFLDPLSDAFTDIQKMFISKQTVAYGNVTNIYTLDQYNENNPLSGDVDYLKNVSYGTWQSLKAADPDSIWIMQAWLFFSSATFWTNDRIEAYLGGVEVDDDLLIIDLVSESAPQWERTNSYYGKNWIWCQLHDYGGNMGLYGQVENVTTNPIEALANTTTSVVGFGLTMEGQEGNEIMYDLLLDQAWSSTPIDTDAYFADWVQSRYAGNTIPTDVYTAWNILRTTVYNNTDWAVVPSVIKSILELSPAVSGLVNRTGHHPTELTYRPSVVVEAWNLMYSAVQTETELYDNPAFAHDLVDFTRQVLVNAFIPYYQELIASWNTSTSSASNIKRAGEELIKILNNLDDVLATNKDFAVFPWIAKARSWGSTTALADFYEYNARNQITLWGPTGQISDYASKQWGGLVSSYYLPRWTTFIDYLASTPVTNYNSTTLTTTLLAFEEAWQLEIWGAKTSEATTVVGSLPCVLAKVKKALPAVFGE